MGLSFPFWNSKLLLLLLTVTVFVLRAFLFPPFSICVISWWVQLRDLPSLKQSFTQLTSAWLNVSLASLTQFMHFLPDLPTNFLGRVCSFGWVDWESTQKEQCLVSFMQPKLCPPIQISRGQTQQFSIFWKGTLQWKHFTSGSNCSASWVLSEVKGLIHLSWLWTP